MLGAANNSSLLSLKAHRTVARTRQSGRIIHIERHGALAACISVHVVFRVWNSVVISPCMVW